eukprot:scaffold233_cov81-Cylindrotheca_fusiformis.AAC.8
MQYAAVLQVGSAFLNFHASDLRLAIVGAREGTFGRSLLMFLSPLQVRCNPTPVCGRSIYVTDTITFSEEKDHQEGTTYWEQRSHKNNILGTTIA